MEITFLKDHLENKKGDTKEVEYSLGNYFVLTKVGEESRDKKEPYINKPKNKKH
jgi:hypothetical protein